jgi:GNAT superfamily N-acetyltransferase
VLADEARFKARLRGSGQLAGGRLDLAIDLDGAAIGRIQTFVPPGRALPPGTFDIGIALREQTRGKGYGREALNLLTGWLFEHQGAQVVEAPTDPANVAMRTVFDRVGWTLAGPVTEVGRRWLLYQITGTLKPAEAAATGRASAGPTLPFSGVTETSLPRYPWARPAGRRRHRPGPPRRSRRAPKRLP